MCYLCVKNNQFCSYTSQLQLNLSLDYIPRLQTKLKELEIKLLSIEYNQIVNLEKTLMKNEQHATGLLLNSEQQLLNHPLAET